MASTTFGWQWPVEQTAMPAATSRNEFPSMSSTMAPCPFSATSGYSRVRDGDMNLASAAMTCCTFGPGTAVTRRGVFTSKVVGISSSKKKIQVGVNQNCAGKKQAPRNCLDSDDPTSIQHGASSETGLRKT